MSRSTRSHATSRERHIRALAETRANLPIEFIPGKSPPRYVGVGYHWTTIGGKPIRYPNAYRWPKIYHRSTLRIVVGTDWRDPCRDIVVDGAETIVVGPFRDFSDGISILRIAPAYIPSGDHFTRVWAIREPHTGHAYHGIRNFPGGNWDGLPEAIQAARTAWKIRDEQTIAVDVLYRDDLSVLVTREDSARAGNCEAGTEAFARARDWTHRYAVPATVLLRSRNDRAIAAAHCAARAVAEILAMQGDE